MSKTTKNYKGKTYKPRKRDGKSKAKGDKKFFGFTSGQHSRKKDGVAVPDKDYVKYGWPFETRNGKALKNIQKERDVKKQLKDFKEKK